MTQYSDLEIPENELKQLEVIAHKAALMAQTAQNVINSHHQTLTDEEFTQYRLAIFKQMLKSTNFSTHITSKRDDDSDYEYEYTPSEGHALDSYCP